MVARLVVYGDLDFVGLVNGKVVNFISPAVSSRGLCATLDCVFDLDVDKSFRASTKAPSSCVVDIGDSVYAQGEVTAQRFSLTWNVQAVIWV
jgi:hypothetical protein